MARRCKYGKLRHKIGRRVCKLKRKRKSSASSKARRRFLRHATVDRTFGRR